MEGEKELMDCAFETLLAANSQNRSDTAAILNL